MYKYTQSWVYHFDHLFTALLQHGQTVCMLVQKVVQSLGNYDAVWEILLKSGRSHFSEFVSFRKCSITWGVKLPRPDARGP